MSKGKSFHVGTCTSDRKWAMSNSRKSDGRNRQTIGGRGPKSLSRRDVSGARVKYFVSMFVSDNIALSSYDAANTHSFVLFYR